MLHNNNTTLYMFKLFWFKYWRKYARSSYLRKHYAKKSKNLILIKKKLTISSKTILLLVCEIYWRRSLIIRYRFIRTCKNRFIGTLTFNLMAIVFARSITNCWIFSKLLKCQKYLSWKWVQGVELNLHHFTEIFLFLIGDFLQNCSCMGTYVYAKGNTARDLSDN